MRAWRGIVAVAAGAAVALAPAAAGAALSPPRAYAASLLATVPVPGSATPVTALPVAMPGPPTSLGSGPWVVGDAREYLVPASVDLASYFASHAAPGSSNASTGTTTGAGGVVAQDTWTLTCASRHVPECDAYAEFTTVDGRQALRVGVQLVWRAITVVRVPSVGVETLTGYGVTSLVNRSSHPVTVTLTTGERQRLAAVVATLKGAPGGTCMEDSELYVVAVRASAHGALLWRASVDECPGTMSVAWAGHTAALDARSCPLTHVVRDLLPATARATRAALADCL